MSVLASSILGMILGGMALITLLTLIQAVRAGKDEPVGLTQIPTEVTEQIAEQKAQSSELRASIQALLAYETLVLVVDDEPMVKPLFSMWFRKHAQRCMFVYAESIRDAITALSKITFNLCIIDLKLQDGNGIELIKYISAYCPTTAIICMTAHATVEITQELMQLGVPIVEKPIYFARIHALMKQMLHGTERIPDDL